MKLTILGSGTMFPTKKRFPSSFLLEADNKKILIDCGFETMARLIEIGVDVRKIDAVFISHFHADHIGDAFNMVCARFVANIYYQKKQEEKLYFFGPKTLEQRYRKWRKLFWPEPTEIPRLIFREGMFDYNFGKIKIETFRVIHVPYFPSVGLRLSHKGKVIVYPGDIGSLHPVDDLIKRSKGADLLIIEASWLKKTPNHFTIHQVLKLVRVASIKRALIVHVPPIPSIESYLKKVAKKEQKIILAHDMMTIKI